MENKRVHPMDVAPPAYPSGPSATYSAPHEQSMQQHQYPGHSYPSGQAQVVVTAPYVTQRMEHVEDNMVVSIVSLFFCCLLGIFAVLKASDAKKAQQRGDIDSARTSADTAKKLAITAIVVGCILVVLSIILGIVLPLGLLVGVSSSVVSTSTYDSNESSSSF